MQEWGVIKSWAKIDIDSDSQSLPATEIPWDNQSLLTIEIVYVYWKKKEKYKFLSVFLYILFYYAESCLRHTGVHKLCLIL